MEECYMIYNGIHKKYIQALGGKVGVGWKSLLKLSFEELLSFS